MSILINLQNQPPFEVSLETFYNCRHQALVRIKASDDPSIDHAPSTIVLVIDVSGSMDAKASTADDSDGASGLSQLDLVKHAARATIESLGDRDRLAVVSFSSQAKVEFNLASMTVENQKLAWKAVNELRPMSSTNLYGGLLRAFDVIQKQAAMPANPNILLLTDGLPNVSPPRGELQTLQNHLDAHPELKRVRIATFGFGYSLKSDLLADIARMGRSIFAFIPDSSFVGTVFVNTVANVLTCASTASTTLKLESANGVHLVGCPTGQEFTKTDWGLQIELPSLLYGQTLDVLIETKGNPAIEPFKAFLEIDGSGESLVSPPMRCVDGLDPEDVYFARAIARASVIGFIRSAGRCKSEESLAEAQAVLTDWRQKASKIFQNLGPSADPGIVKEISSILEDLTGQVTEAYSRYDWHSRWGIHYTLSLAAAHSLQQCSNFKDPGLQTYATQKFSLLRDQAESKFINLPPPKPSRVVRTQVRSMRAFYNANTSCFARGSVWLKDGSSRDISQVRAGDMLQSSSGLVRVRCVVETPSVSGVEGLVELPDGVLVTPWHPVRPRGQISWSFPYQLVFPEWKACTSVFNLVLEDGQSSFRIGDYDAVSLGHGIEGDPVAEHAFFGTDLVVNELRGMQGWKEGYIRLPSKPLRRDPETGTVVGFVSNAKDTLNHSMDSVVV